jgi:hypothetical protein
MGKVQKDTLNNVSGFPASSSWAVSRLFSVATLSALVAGTPFFDKSLSAWVSLLVVNNIYLCLPST